MCNEKPELSFHQSLLRRVTAKIAYDVGFHSAHTSAIDALAEVLSTYLSQLLSITNDFAQLADRYDPQLEDLVAACEYLSIDFGQLRDYLLNVEPSPLEFPLPLYPVPVRPNRVHDYCDLDQDNEDEVLNDEEEKVEKPEWLEDWMPSLDTEKHCRIAAEKLKKEADIREAKRREIEKLKELEEQNSINENQETVESDSKAAVQEDGKAASNGNEGEADIGDVKKEDESASKSKIVFRFPSTKTLEESAATEDTKANDSSEQDGGAASSTTAIEALFSSASFQHFRQSLKLDSAALESRLRAADSNRLVNNYVSREATPEPVEDTKADDNSQSTKKPRKKRRDPFDFANQKPVARKLSPVKKKLQDGGSAGSGSFGLKVNLNFSSAFEANQSNSAQNSIMTSSMSSFLAAAAQIGASSASTGPQLGEDGKPKKRKYTKRALTPGTEKKPKLPKIPKKLQGGVQGRKKLDTTLLDDSAVGGFPALEGLGASLMFSAGEGGGDSRSRISDNFIFTDEAIFAAESSASGPSKAKKSKKTTETAAVAGTSLMSSAFSFLSQDSKSGNSLAQDKKQRSKNLGGVPAKKIKSQEVIESSGESSDDGGDAEKLNERMKKSLLATLGIMEESSREQQKSVVDDSSSNIQQFYSEKQKFKFDLPNQSENDETSHFKDLNTDNSNNKKTKKKKKIDKKRKRSESSEEQHEEFIPKKEEPEREESIQSPIPSPVPSPVAPPSAHRFPHDELDESVTQHSSRFGEEDGDDDDSSKKGHSKKDKHKKHKKKDKHRDESKEKHKKHKKDKKEKHRDKDSVASGSEAAGFKLKINIGGNSDRDSPIPAPSPSVDYQSSSDYEKKKKKKEKKEKKAAEKAAAAVTAQEQLVFIQEDKQKKSSGSDEKKKEKQKVVINFNDDEFEAQQSVVKESTSKSAKTQETASKVPEKVVSKLKMKVVEPVVDSPPKKKVKTSTTVAYADDSIGVLFKPDTKEKKKKDKKKDNPTTIKIESLVEAESAPEPKKIIRESEKSCTIIRETITTKDEKEFYCPSCQRPDDGSPMIGCDKCEEWFHYLCVGIFTEPTPDACWFCPLCQKPEKEKKKPEKEKKKPEKEKKKSSGSAEKKSKTSASSSLHIPPLPVLPPNIGQELSIYPVGFEPEPSFLPEFTISPQIVSQPSNSKKSKSSKSGKKSSKYSSSDGQNPASTGTCPVCNYSNIENAAIVACERCNQMYHWACVGIHNGAATIDWFCKHCRQVEQLLNPPAKQPPQMTKTDQKFLAAQASKAFSKAASISSQESSEKCGSCHVGGDEEEGREWIQCDDCDTWYHLECQGVIKPPPDNEKWNCSKCQKKKKSKSKFK